MAYGHCFVLCRFIGQQSDLIGDEHPFPSVLVHPEVPWDVVQAYKARGRTVLLTTHYMEEAAQLCDRVAVVDHGQVIALGTPRELIASLGAEHVVEFSVSGDRVMGDDEVRALPSVEDVAREDGVWRVTVREVHRAVPALLAMLTEHRLEPTHLTTHHATLEDVFMSLTGRRLRDG